VAKSTDGGVTWSSTNLGDVGPAPATAPPPAGSSGYPRMAVDPKNGNLYVVYVGYNFGDLDVIMQRSTDKGATWSPPARVNDDPMGNGARQLGPQVFVAPNGRVDVIWLDARTAYPSAVIPRPAGYGDLYYASSSDGGATFTANRRISDRSVNLDVGLTGRIGSYTWWGPAAAPLGNDAVLFAWSDGRFGNVDNDTNDIMMATLQLGDAGPAEITELPKASPANLSVAVSQFAYPGGSERIGSTFTSKLVVVNKDDVAGAWAGAVLARQNNAPLMVVDGTSLTKEQKDEIKRLSPTGTFVIGDEKAVPQKLVDEITKAGVITSLAPGATTTVPATTTAPPTTAAGAATTTTIANTNTGDRAKVIRLTGATPADIGKAVAGAIDVRSAEEKGRAVPGVPGAVVVNAASKESSAAIAFAAGQRYPILFVDKDGVPPATADALNALNVQTTWVIGGPDAISDATMGKLTGAKRLGGADTAATTAAVVKELTSRGLPVNVAFVADESRPVDAAVVGAAVARTGGILVVAPGGTSGAAEEQIKALGLTDQVDQVVVAKSATSGSVPWALIVVSAILAVAGIVLLDRAARKSRATKATAPPAVDAKAPKKATN